MTTSDTSPRKDKVDRKASALVGEASKYRSDLERRGVIYLARVPPQMKPNKIRSVFEDYGEITRLYLAEEDVEVRRKRKLGGGNGSKQFAEGWIEFADKRIAKQVAMSLNNCTIGHKKGDFYHDDMWNIKYLRKFKWDYLTEKVAYERRVRETKLQMELMQSKKSNAEFADLVEKTAAMKHIDARKRKRSGESNDIASTGRIGLDEVSDAKKRKFKQNAVLAEQHGEKQARIFGGTLAQNVFGTGKSR